MPSLATARPETHTPQSAVRRWTPRSIIVLFVAWLILQLGGIFSPGLLDDVDSIYIQIAREMLARHDFVTPTIDGIRFFDKPPLMYWMASASMSLFGVHDWAARLPLALAVLALLLSTYALGNRLFASVSPEHAPDRGGFYSALALATAIGPYLYTRFFIPDILIALWMSLGVHLFLIALERIEPSNAERSVISTDQREWRDPRISSESAEQLRESEFLSETNPDFLSETHPGAPFIAASSRWVGLRAKHEPSSVEQPKSPLIPCLGFFIALKSIAFSNPERSVISTDQREWRDPRISSESAEQSAKSELLSETNPGAPFIAASSRWVGLRVQHEPLSSEPSKTLLPCLAFAAVMALNVLTKGLIGAVFPIGFVVLHLALTRRLRLLPRFHLLSGTAVFLLIAAPWHILAAIRNPAIELPAGLGLPAHGGWAWFYLYNEHFARFLSKRIPHDYGQTPIWLFWFYTAIWTMPWVTFLPSAIATQISNLGKKLTTERAREAALAPLLWAGLVIGFFTVSARQEYYALPAIPALTLLAGGFLARADTRSLCATLSNTRSQASRSALRWSAFFLAPLATVIAAICGYLALFAPVAPAGATLSDLLATNPDLYNLSLGHLFDLTGPAMGLFRGPLAAVAIGMVTLGPAALRLRWSGHTYAANLTLAAGMIVTLLAAHTGLSRFYPILGSKDLATAINTTLKPDDVVLVDCELTCGSSLIFYTNHPVGVVNGRVNGLWYGSFWPDSPRLFEDDASLRTLWASPRRVFLLTYHTAARRQDLSRFAPANVFALSGGKSILFNR